MTGFTTLFDCAFKHEYAQNNGLPLLIIPTEHTKNLLTNSRCYFKSGISSFKIITQVNNQRANALQALYESEPKASFTFKIKVSDPSFFNYSQPLLDQTLFHTGEPMSDDEISIKLNKYKEIETRVIFDTQNGALEKQILAIPASSFKQLPKESLCVVRVPLQELDISAFDQEYTPAPLNVVLPFKCRRTKWRYHINIPGVKPGANSIVDKTEDKDREVITFKEFTPSVKPNEDHGNPLPVTFISQQSIPLGPRAGYRFTLQLNAKNEIEKEKTLVERLPMANLQNLSKDPHHESGLVSDVYISR